MKFNPNSLHHVLESTDFPGLGLKKSGKVRDIYDMGDRMAFIATDRLSAFDRHLALIPFKGQVLTQSSVFWFEETRDIVPNHVLDIPDPNVIIGKKLSIFPVEVIVRGYLTGVTSTSVWTAYGQGKREFCGNTLPEGMVKNQPFEKPLVTPTTKDETRDEPIDPQGIVSEGRMTQEEWEEVSGLALALFKRGTEVARRHNLILVDTKYEFGRDEKGRIYLCDEIHTPDSSRYWIQESYEKNFQKGREPEYIDKEMLRIWFKERSDPYKDKILPDAPRELILKVSERYVQLYEMITGKSFDPGKFPIENRVKANLEAKGYLR